LRVECTANVFVISKLILDTKNQLYLTKFVIIYPALNIKKKTLSFKYDREREREREREKES